MATKSQTRATMSLTLALLSKAKKSEDHTVTVDETYLRAVKNVLSDALKAKEANS